MEKDERLSVDQLHQITLAQFYGALDAAQKKMVNLSNRGLKRSIYAAIAHKVSDAEFEFQKKEEAELAGLLAKILDLRVDLLALKYEKENTNE